MSGNAHQRRTLKRAIKSLLKNQDPPADTYAHPAKQAQGAEPEIHPAIKWLRSIGGGSLLFGIAGALMNEPEYFFLWVSLVYCGVIALFIDLRFERWFRKTHMMIKSTTILVLVGILMLFSTQVVFVSAPLELSFMSSNAEYPTGTIVGGIVWNSRFSELTVMIINPTTNAYKDIDLTLKTDEPVAGIGQLTNVSGVTFSDASALLSVKPEWVDFSSGSRERDPATLLATTAGYRMLCETLPPKNHMELVLAIAKPSGKKGYAVRLSDGSNSWYRGTRDDVARLEDYFEPRRIAKQIKVVGKYVAAKKRRSVLKEDLVQDMLRNAFPRTLDRRQFFR